MIIKEYLEYTPQNVQYLSGVARQLTEGAPVQDRKVLSPAEVRMMLFRGTPFWVGYAHDGVEPVTLNATKFGKKKTNTWEPYANFYIAYTTPAKRRQGFAKELAEYVRIQAVLAGCVRMKSLAGTRLGYLLHRSLGDRFWGFAPTGELLVDSPIVSSSVLITRGRQPFPTDATPMGVRKYSNLVSPMDPDYIEEYIEQMPLRFDRG